MERLFQKSKKEPLSSFFVNNTLRIPLLNAGQSKPPNGLQCDIAKSVLKQGTVKGRPLSKRQKALFKAIASLGNKPVEKLKQAKDLKMYQAVS